MLCLADRRVVSVIPGARNIGQLEANLRAARPLPPPLKAALDAATADLAAAMGHKNLDVYESDANQRTH